MDTYHVVLYVHLLALFIGIGAGAVTLACLFQLRAAQTLAEAAPWGALAGKAGNWFPVAALGLFGSGAYMTSDVWTWDTGWIEVSIAGLALVALQGPLVAKRAANKKLKTALKENGPGELREPARKVTRHPAIWVPQFSNLALVLGIVWNMTQKPSTASSIVTLLVAYAVGAALALWCSRAPATAAEPAAEPAA